jgi:addiction module RelE/StbE family toxin
VQIELHKNFVKSYRKLPFKVQEKFKERKDLFLQDPFHPLLRNHALKGKYGGCRSVDITGDIRLIFTYRNDFTSVFLEIGSHSELYE